MVGATAALAMRMCSSIMCCAHDHMISNTNVSHANWLMSVIQLAAQWLVMSGIVVHHWWV